MRELGEMRFRAFYDELRRIDEPASLQKHGANAFVEGVRNFGARNWHALTGRGAAGMENVLPEVAEKGLTSLPGIAQGLVKRPGETLRTLGRSQVAGQGLINKALSVGVPAVSLAAAVREKDDPNDPQKGRHLGRAVAGTAAGVLTHHLPFVAGTAAQLAAEGVGGAVGGAVDKLRKPRVRRPQGVVQGPAVTAPEEARGQHVPTERVLTPAALGQAPETLG